MDGWMAGWMDEWMDGWPQITDSRTYIYWCNTHVRHRIMYLNIQQKQECTGRTSMRT